MRRLLMIARLARLKNYQDHVSSIQTSGPISRLQMAQCEDLGPLIPPYLATTQLHLISPERCDVACIRFYFEERIDDQFVPVTWDTNRCCFFPGYVAAEICDHLAQSQVHSLRSHIKTLILSGFRP